MWYFESQCIKSIKFLTIFISRDCKAWMPLREYLCASKSVGYACIVQLASKYAHLHPYLRKRHLGLNYEPFCDTNPVCQRKL